MWHWNFFVEGLPFANIFLRVANMSSVIFGGQTWPSLKYQMRSFIGFQSINLLKSVPLPHLFSSVHLLYPSWKVEQWKQLCLTYLVGSGGRGTWGVRRYLRGRVQLFLVRRRNICWEWGVVSRIYNCSRSPAIPLSVPGQRPQLWPLWHHVAHQRCRPGLWEHFHCQELLSATFTSKIRLIKCLFCENFPFFHNLL